MVRKLVLLLEILLLIAVVVVAMFFLGRNEASVELDLLLYRTGTIEVGVLVLVVFMLGACLGLLVRIPDALWRGLINKVRPEKPAQASDSSEKTATGSAVAKGRV